VTREIHGLLGLNVGGRDPGIKQVVEKAGEKAECSRGFLIS
jgi:hypothetical protein